MLNQLPPSLQPSLNKCPSPPLKKYTVLLDLPLLIISPMSLQLPLDQGRKYPLASDGQAALQYLQIADVYS
jgi:hypothetical protein